MSFALDDLKFDANGLIPAIIQDAENGQVLMMAWMNRLSLEKTLETGKVHFWSRSRQKLWLKGEESGNIQTLKSMSKDCDVDCLLLRVDQKGAACHEGYRTCFFREISADGKSWSVQGTPLFDPKKVYKK